MVIKKPYAFLIKHFKIIHLIMLVPMLYLSFCFKDIADFFRIYVNENMVSSLPNTSDMYISLLMIIASIVLIIVNITILLLMKSKKKPSLLYLIASIYYAALLLLIIVDYNAFLSIDRKNVDEILITIINGVSTFIVFPGYALMIAFLSQTVGFNIKTFKFDKTLGLQITDEDEEEVEINLVKSDNNIKRNAVHALRELKYYILENKAIFTFITIVIVIAVGVAIYLDVEVYNKRYEINQAFALDTFTITLKDSYLTNVDYTGKEIASNKYFLAVKLAINYEVPEGQEKYYEPQNIDSNNFRIYTDKYYIYPSYDRSDRFLDIGKPYHGEKIYPNKGANYVLVYELDESMIQNKYQMKILSDLSADNGELIPRYKVINIKPTNIIEPVKLDSKKMNDKIDLSDTTLGEMKYTLNDITYDNKYLYEYESCSETIGCSNQKGSILPTSGKVLIIIKDSEEWDYNSSYYLNGDKDFYGDFASLSYTFENDAGQRKQYSTRLKNVTPSTISNVKIYEANSLITKGKDIKLNITVRNKTLTIPIPVFNKN